MGESTGYLLILQYNVQTEHLCIYCIWTQVKKDQMDKYVVYFDPNENREVVYNILRWQFLFKNHN